MQTKDFIVTAGTEEKERINFIVEVEGNEALFAARRLSHISEGVKKGGEKE